MEQFVKSDHLTNERQTENLITAMDNEDKISDYVEVTFVDEAFEPAQKRQSFHLNDSDNKPKLCEVEEIERQLTVDMNSTADNMEPNMTEFVETIVEGISHVEKNQNHRHMRNSCDDEMVTVAQTRENKKHPRSERKCRKNGERRMCDMCGETQGERNNKSVQGHVYDDTNSDKDGASEKLLADDNEILPNINKDNSMLCHKNADDPDREFSIQNFQNERFEFSRSNSRCDDNTVVLNMYENPWPNQFESEEAETAFNKLSENPNLKQETGVYIDSVRPKKSELSSRETVFSIKSSSALTSTNQRKMCLWTIFTAIMTSILVSAAVCAVIIYLQKEANRAMEQVGPQMAMSAYQRNASGLRFALSLSDSRMHLYLDQQALLDDGKLLWTKQDLQDAFQTPDILLSTFGGSGKFGCAGVSRRGFYQLVSHITFRYYKATRDTQIYHAVNLERDRLNGQILKNSFTLPLKHNRAGRELRPSNLIGFQFLNPGDRLCVTVSNTDLVYVSVTDNYFTLVKL